MANRKRFSLGAILSIKTGVMCVSDIDEIYNIVNFMTGDSAFTSQLPRFSGECKPYLSEQLPQLNYITADMLAGKKCLSVVAELEAKHGKTHLVHPIHHEDHQVLDPHTELAFTHPHIETIDLEFDDGGDHEQ